MPSWFILDPFGSILGQILLQRGNPLTLLDAHVHIGNLLELKNHANRLYAASRWKVPKDGFGHERYVVLG